eukprot:gene17753-21149_t
MGAMEMGSPAAFAVPTGAFGNCFAGYMAKQIGVPISVIVAATNANDIVHRTISRGDMRTGQNLPTLSPAMDIQGDASNLHVYQTHGSTDDRARAAVAGSTDDRAKAAV